MYKAAVNRYIFLLGMVLERNEMWTKILFSKDFVYKFNASPHATYYRCYKLFIAK